MRIGLYTAVGEGAGAAATCAPVMVVLRARAQAALSARSAHYRTGRARVSGVKGRDPAQLDVFSELVVTIGGGGSSYIVNGDDMSFAPHGSSLLPCNQTPALPGGCLAVKEEESE